MKIRLYNFSSCFGGQERYLECLCQALWRRRIETEFFGGPDRLIYSVQRSSKLGPTSGAAEVELLNGNRALFLRGWRRRRSDLRIYVQHSLINDFQSGWFRTVVRGFLIKLLLRRIDIVIRVTPEALPDHYAQGKVFTVFNGVPLPSITNTRSTSDDFTLLMVGTVCINKNQLLALRLLILNKDARLIIVGDGPERERLQAWAKAEGIDSRVMWAGSTDSVGEFFLRADALLLLSKYEAFPYAVLEAMSYGVPVISARVGGVAAVIRHRENGLLLPGTNLQSLEAAVSMLQVNRDWVKTLGANARQMITDRYTVDRMTDDLLALVTAALAARRSSL